MQDPKDLDKITCDVCGDMIAPRVDHIQLTRATIWGGPKSPALVICAKCVVEKFGIKPEAMASPVEPEEAGPDE